MRIEIFDDLYDALLFLEVEAETAEEYFKGEVFRTPDGRWRVGILFEPQLELKFDGFTE